MRLLPQLDTPPWPNSRRQAAWALLGFSLLSCAWSWRFFLHPGASAPSGGRGDIGIFAWFLTYVPWAVLHGHSPFVSHLLQFPRGVSTMWNTALLLPAVLLGPLTLLAGPIASIAFLTIAGPASSAFTMWLLARRHAGVLPAAAAGLLFGFGPVMAATGYSHYQLSLLTLVPLIVMAVEDLFVGDRSPRRVGLRLGILLACQLLVGEEVLLILAVATAVAVCIWAAVLAVGQRSALGPALRRLVVGGGVTLLVFGVISAVPLFEQFTGPYVLHSEIQATALYDARPQDLVVGASRLWLHGTLHSAVNSSEVMGYLGLPLLLAIAAGAVLMRRNRTYLVLFGTLLVLELFSLGPTVKVANPQSGELPWAALAHVGLFVNLLPIRFGIACELLAALLLALLIREVRQRSWARLGHWPAAALAVTVLLPLLPHGLPASPAPNRPGCLQGPALRRLQDGVPTLLLPYPGVRDVRSQLWIAEAHFPFPIVGGYAVHRGLRGPYLDGVQGPLRRLFIQISRHLGAPPSPNLIALALQQLRRDGVRRAIVTPTEAAGRESALLAGALKQPGELVGGCRVFTAASGAPSL